MGSFRKDHTPPCLGRFWMSRNGGLLRRPILELIPGLEPLVRGGNVRPRQLSKTLC